MTQARTGDDPAPRRPRPDVVASMTHHHLPPRRPSANRLVSAPAAPAVDPARAPHPLRKALDGPRDCDCAGHLRRRASRHPRPRSQDRRAAGRKFSRRMWSEFPCAPRFQLAREPGGRAQGRRAVIFRPHPLDQARRMWWHNEAPNWHRRRTCSALEQTPKVVNCSGPCKSGSSMNTLLR